MSYYGWGSSNQAKTYAFQRGCSFLLCLKKFMSAYLPQGRSGSCDALTPSFNPCLASHSTAWASRRGQDGKVTVSLLVPRAACRFQDSGPALTFCFPAARGYLCTGKVGVRSGPAVNKVSMSVPSLAGGKEPRSSCSDLWVFLPGREEEVRTRPGRGTWQRLVTLPLTDFLETAQHV